MSDALDRLAEAAGILPTFRDYFGNETVVSDATKMALLEAMGYDQPGSVRPSTARLRRGACAERSRQSLRSRSAQDDTEGSGFAQDDVQRLPPVCVVRAGEVFDVPCVARRTRATWTIALEGGGAIEGVVARNADHVRVETPLAPGYHVLTMRAGRTTAKCLLIASPSTCFVTVEMESGRIWALATQLYALRSQRNWGIGDFSDLTEFATLASSAGAGAVALNPLHELFPSNPWAASPYAPSSRLFLNVAYIDVTAVPDFAESAPARAQVSSSTFACALEHLRAADLVDYGGVMRAKLDVLGKMFEAFRTNHLERAGAQRGSAFRAFVRNGGQRLERLARYEAMAEHFRALDSNSYGWLQWPAAYRSPESPEVEKFAREHRDRVDFYWYAQWLADEQLAHAAASARDRGVGLYRDLAVGVDRNGADAWSDPGAIAVQASLGAPADPLNTQGQNWGLPPLSPRALRERAYEPFISLLRANMRRAAILRVDHVMALQRAFWIPQGRQATDGAYVRYPLDDMLGVLALESVRNRCVVVGEDLGTVPDGFRERLQVTRTLSSRLVYFERTWDGAFHPPSAYPRLAAASIGTHDLPPLLGWWTGGGDDERRHARFMLVDALEREGCIDAAGAAWLREDAAAGGTLAVGTALSEAVHRFLARTPSMLTIVAIEDVLGEVQGVNVPGTVDEHPNWRRKRTLALDALAHDGRLFRIGDVMRDPWNAAMQAQA